MDVLVQTDAMRRAIRAGLAGAVGEMLRKGADPDALDDLGHAPLHWAALDGDTSVMAVILAAGASVDARTGDGYTALHIAASAGHLEACRRLLEAGADPGALTPDGKTAADIAAESGNDAVVALVRSWCPADGAPAP